MIPLIAAAGLMAAGTGMNMLGNHQRAKAQKKVLRNMRRATAERDAAEQAAAQEERDFNVGQATDRQNAIGSFLGETALAERPGTDQGFMNEQKGVLTDLGNMTKDQGTPMFSGAPAVQSQSMQDTQTGQDNAAISRAMLADHTNRLITEHQANADTRMSLGELMRSTKGKSMRERMQLARALRELDWARKTGQLQRHLDSAGRKGAALNMIGGLATQVGGMGMSAVGGGMFGGGGGGGPTMDPNAGGTDISRNPNLA